MSHEAESALTGAPVEKPLEARLRELATEAKARAEDTVTLPPLNWKTVLVIADAIKSYFADDAPMRCFVCDSARSTQIDCSIANLADEALRMSLAIQDLEIFLGEQSGYERPADDQIRKMRIQGEVRARCAVRTVSHEAGIPITAELRAKMLGEKE